MERFEIVPSILTFEVPDYRDGKAKRRERRAKERSTK